MHTVGYIISYMFSGSTLLTLMLAAHSKISTVGELIGVNPRILSDRQAAMDYFCSCGEKVRKCVFWNELSNRLERKGIAFSHPHLGTRFTLSSTPLLNKLLVRSLASSWLETVREWFVRSIPPFRNRFQKIAETNAAAIKEILQMTKKQVFIDESKNHLHFARLTSIQDLDVRPIFLTRDGRGVALSVNNHGIIMDFVRAVKSWVAVNKDAQRTIVATGRPCLHVRYEDICTRPSESLKRIHRFLGLNPESWPPPTPSYEHHILGNDLRLHFDGTIKLDKKWQMELSEEELMIFSRIAGKMNCQFGYR